MISLLFFTVYFSANQMKVILIVSLESWVNKYLLVYSPVYFPEVVHVQLPDERTPIAMPKIFFQHIFNEVLSVGDNQLISFLAEVNKGWEILRNTRIYLHHFQNFGDKVGHLLGGVFIGV